MEIKLSIIIVNYNASDFIKIGLYALDKLTKFPYKVYNVDNGSKLKDYKKLIEYCNCYNNVYLERIETKLRGSLAHGTALNYLVNKVDTPYFAILDADATFLIKNWDYILINELNEKTPIIGTQAPPGKPSDFPLMFAILFRTEEFKKLNIDFRPKDISNKQDTGWELREKYLKNGYSGKILHFKSTRIYDQGPFKDMICAEYYLDGYDHIFASHFGRGSSMGLNKYGRGEGVGFIYKLPIISSPLRYLKGYREKIKWINRCKEIIDNQ